MLDTAIGYGLSVGAGGRIVGIGSSGSLFDEVILIRRCALEANVMLVQYY